MPDRHGVATFPGAGGTISATYEIGQGISPATIVLRCQPAGRAPAQFGAVVFDDGFTRVPIPDCKLDVLRSRTDKGGTVWTLEILDRRWRWRDTGTISGVYNQIDEHGKLIPWTIRSPAELAVLCLDAMGETGYTIDLPPGLDSRFGASFSEFLGVGQNFPVSQANPPIAWDGENPAQALQRLCDEFGRRIVYNVFRNAIDIVVPGIGPGLPGGSISEESPALDLPETPGKVGVIGDPSKYTVLLLVDAVGKEWDGSWKPIDSLSYAPEQSGTTQAVRITVGTNEDEDGSCTIQVWQDGTEVGKLLYEETLDGQEPATIAAAIAGACNSADFTATADNDVVLVTATKAGVAFDISARIDAGTPLDGTYVRVEMIRAAVKPGRSWALCPPPLFPSVRETDRLTKQQAQDLASQYVWKAYRVTNRDATGKGPINVPGFGRLARRHQLVLLDSQVAQVVPEDRDGDFFGKDGLPVVHNFYNGYSRDRPNECYGSIAASVAVLGNPFYRRRVTDRNTPPDSLVKVPFSVDPTHQVFLFSDYVYQQGKDGSYLEPDLKFLVGCHVLHPVTNEYIAYQAELTLGGNAGPYVLRKPDVQLNVTAVYDIEKGRILQVGLLEADAVARADYYLAGMAAEYRLTGALTRKYNGLVQIPLSGTVQQVSWTVGEGGCFTEASVNNEHSPWVAPYGERRRIEALRPYQQDRYEQSAKPRRLRVERRKRPGQ